MKNLGITTRSEIHKYALKHLYSQSNHNWSWHEHKNGYRKSTKSYLRDVHISEAEIQDEQRQVNCKVNQRFIRIVITDQYLLWLIIISRKGRKLPIV